MGVTCPKLGCDKKLKITILSSFPFLGEAEKLENGNKYLNYFHLNFFKPCAELEDQRQKRGAAIPFPFQTHSFHVSVYF